jgi:hypothetical protein
MPNRFAAMRFPVPLENRRTHRSGKLDQRNWPAKVKASARYLLVADQLRQRKKDNVM